MKLKQSLLILSLVVMGVLFAACGGGTDPVTKVNLTVTKNGTGSGTVTSQPAGITTTTNTFGFNKGTKVTLTADAADGSNFAGFSNNCAAVAGDANKCTVTLNAATEVTATFNKEDGGNPQPQPTVNSVTVTPSTLPLQVGTTGQLTANVDATGGAATTVTWASDAPAIADVDQNGVVTAKAEGTATITATSTADATKSGSAPVTVTTQPPPAGVTSVTIDRDTLTLNVGQSEDLEVDVETTGNADESVTWASDNQAVATVNQDGLVTGATVGQATITATSVADPSKSDTVQVTVSSGTTTPGSGSFSVIAGTDDAEQFLEFSSSTFPPNSVFTTSDDLDITNDINPSSGSRGNQLIGIRFQNVTIPKGATITSAYIQFTAINKPTPGAGTPSFTIKGEAVDNAQPFVEKAINGISDRPTTTAEMAWAPAAWQGNKATMASRSADITSVIQEIVNRQGWAASNALAVVISGPNSATDYRAAKAFEADTTGNGDGAPVLVVEYTTPAP